MSTKETAEIAVAHRASFHRRLHGRRGSRRASRSKWDSGSTDADVGIIIGIPANLNIDHTMVSFGWSCLIALVHHVVRLMKHNKT